MQPPLVKRGSEDFVSDSGRLVHVATAGSGNEPTSQSQAPSQQKVGEGVSAFLGRVLDQLSITSWLPAVFFVGNAAVLLALQGDRQLVLTDAVETLIDMQWGAIIVLLFAVIISSMVIQAFEFESLRFWEGYLRSPLLARWAARGIHRYEKRQVALDAEFKERQLEAFDDARRRALDRNLKTEVQHAWNVREKMMHGRRLDVDDSEAQSLALGLDWPRHGDPTKLHALDITRLKSSELPEPHRLLPTRLGNAMRTAEDHLMLHTGEDLEGFWIRHEDDLPRTIVSEFDAYRRRLDMYLSLMFVLASLSVLSSVCFWGFTYDIGWRIGVPALYVVAVWVSYRAAVASALGLGQALKEANRWVERRTPPTATPLILSNELHLLATIRTVRSASRTRR